MAEDQEEGQGLTEDEKANLEASLDDTGKEDESAGAPLSLIHI